MAQAWQFVQAACVTNVWRKDLQWIFWQILENDPLINQDQSCFITGNWAALVKKGVNSDSDSEWYW